MELHVKTRELEAELAISIASNEELRIEVREARAMYIERGARVAELVALVRAHPDCPKCQARVEELEAALRVVLPAAETRALQYSPEGQELFPSAIARMARDTLEARVAELEAFIDTAGRLEGTIVRRLKHSVNPVTMGGEVRGKEE